MSEKVQKNAQMGVADAKIQSSQKYTFAYMEKRHTFLDSNTKAKIRTRERG